MHIDYFIAPQSPWTYLGHDRFASMLAAHGATTRVLPVDLGQVFPVSGGLALPKRAPQRQAYRLVELTRFSQWLKLPLNLHPRHFPVAGDAAAKLIIATQQRHGAAAAMQLAGRVLTAVWAQERNIADPDCLSLLLGEAGLPAEVLEQSRDAPVQAEYAANTQAAIDAGVFGSPSYVVDGEIFWGQDRLDFLERRLRA